MVHQFEFILHDIVDMKIYSIDHRSTIFFSIFFYHYFHELVTLTPEGKKNLHPKEITGGHVVRESCATLIDDGRLTSIIAQYWIRATSVSLTYPRFAEESVATIFSHISNSDTSKLSKSVVIPPSLRSSLYPEKYNPSFTKGLTPRTRYNTCVNVIPVCRTHSRKIDKNIEYRAKYLEVVHGRRRSCIE